MLPRPGHPHLVKRRKVWRVYYVVNKRVRFVIARTFEGACIMARVYGWVGKRDVKV